MILTEFLLARIAEDEDGPFFNAWHVGRVLAECEAKRRIVDRTQGPVAHAGQDIERRAVLSLLAAPYADHPDYRREWKP